jgi:hypothetical protein
VLQTSGVGPLRRHPRSTDHIISININIIIIIITISSQQQHSSSSSLTAASVSLLRVLSQELATTAPSQ